MMRRAELMHLQSNYKYFFFILSTLILPSGCFTCSLILHLKNKTNKWQRWVQLTNEVQFKAFAGVLGIADELQPHGAGGGIQGGVEQLAGREHAQQASLVAAAIKHLAGRRKRETGRERAVRKKNNSMQLKALLFLTLSRSSSASLKSRARSWMPLPGCVWME